MKYARIDSGVVVELLETDLDIRELYHPDMLWVPVTDDVEVGYVSTNGTYTPAPLPTVTPDEGRLWRNSELYRADNEIRKHQDSDSSAEGTESNWREYRVALREWPDTSEFPSQESRPTLVV